MKFGQMLLHPAQIILFTIEFRSGTVLVGVESLTHHIQLIVEIAGPALVDIIPLQIAIRRAIIVPREAVRYRPRLFG